jgi:hypothetical protein
MENSMEGTIRRAGLFSIGKDAAARVACVLLWFVVS